MGLCLIQKTQTGFRFYMYFLFIPWLTFNKQTEKSDSCFMSIQRTFFKKLKQELKACFDVVFVRIISDEFLHMLLENIYFHSQYQ